MPEPDELLSTTAPEAEGDSLTHSAHELSPTIPRADTPPTPLSLPPGYSLISDAGPRANGVLGRGGMGIVYAAVQVNAERPVALKRILAADPANASEVQRFLTEAKAVAGIDHPNVVKIYEVGEYDDLPFFSLEFCPRGSLADRIREQPLTPREAASMVESIARGVASAHLRRVIHRDLKPANILLAEDGTPKVADFGLAKRVADDSDLTIAGSVMGTPSYMAPEQAVESKGVDLLADVYALGAILYACLTGRPPFQGASVIETLRLVQDSEPIPPRQANANIPRDLETICLKCLHKQRSKRYPSAAAFADDLRRWLDGEPIEARPAGVLERGQKWIRRNPVVTAMGLAVFLAMAVGTGFSLWYANEANHATQRAEHEAEEVKRQKGIVEQQNERILADSERIESEAKRNRRLVDAYACQEAQSFLEAGDTEQASERLDSIAPENCDWERFHLYARAFPFELGGYDSFEKRPIATFSQDGSSIVLTANHERAVISDSLLVGPEFTTELDYLASPTRFSLGGRYVALTHRDHSIHIFDAKKRKLISKCVGHNQRVSSLHFSRDGARLVTTSSDRTARVWDVQNGKELRKLQAPRVRMSDALLSPDGRTVVTRISGNKRAHLWRLDPPAEPIVLDKHSAQITCMAFSTDGSRILTGSSDRSACVWDSSTGRHLAQLNGHDYGVTAIAFSPDGKRIATGSLDKTIRIWDAITGTQLSVLEGHTQRIEFLEFSPESEHLVSTSPDKSVRAWDTKSGQQVNHLLGVQGAKRILFSPETYRIRSYSFAGAGVLHGDSSRYWRIFRGHTHGVPRAVLSTDSSRLITGSDDRTVRLWNLESGEFVVLPDHPLGVRFVGITNDGQHVVTTSIGPTGSGHSVRVWNAETGKFLHELKGHTGKIRSVALASDGRRLTTGSDDNTVRVWDLVTAKSLHELKGHTRSVVVVLFSVDGSRVISASNDGTVRVWDAETGDQLRLIESDAESDCVRSTPDRQWLIVGESKRIGVWNLESPSRSYSLDLEGKTLRGLDLSVDGSLLAGALHDHTVKVWTIGGEDVAELKGHTREVNTVAFSPNGQRIVTASRDTTARVWDARTGKELCVLRGHSKEVHLAAFSRLGRYIVTASEDGTARVWIGAARPRSSR